MNDRPEKVDPPADTQPQVDPITARLDRVQKDIELALEDLDAAEKERRAITSKYDEPVEEGEGEQAD